MSRREGMPHVEPPRGRERQVIRYTTRTYAYRVRQTRYGRLPARPSEVLPYLRQRIARRQKELQPEADERR